MKMVIIKGAGDKAFCAGGDVRGMYCHIKEWETKLSVLGAMSEVCTVI